MNYQYMNVYQKITVSSIEEIYETICKYKIFHKLSSQSVEEGEPRIDVFYRGQGDSGWDIAPSLVRSPIPESHLLEKYSIKEPMSLLGTIAYIQHYFQNTRFIDFTLNPDVAIYFSCASHHDKDGAFYIFPYAPHKAEWYTAVVLSELTRIQDKDEISVEELSEEVLKNNPKLRTSFSTLTELNGAIMSFLDHGFMVLPDSESYCKNIRLQRQKGCFYICGVKFSKKIATSDRWLSRAGNNRFNPHSAVVPSEMVNGNALVKLIIPKQAKTDFLYQLSLKGITENYLFPDLDSKTEITCN